MRKVFLFAALVIGSYSGFATTPVIVTDANPEAKLPEPTLAVSLVGKWHAIDMTMKMPAGQKPLDHKAVLARIKQQNMGYEFKEDGTLDITGEGRPTSTLKYKRVGNKVETIDPDGKKVTIDIVKLTDKALSLKMMEGRMVVMMERL